MSHVPPEESLSDIWYQAGNACHFSFFLSTYLINGLLFPKYSKRSFTLVAAWEGIREWQRPSVIYWTLSSLLPFCDIFLHPSLPFYSPFSFQRKIWSCHDHVSKGFSDFPLTLVAVFRMAPMVQRGEGTHQHLTAVWCPSLSRRPIHTGLFSFLERITLLPTSASLPPTPLSLLFSQLLTCHFSAFHTQTKLKP